jgi:SPP1 gp7 family putative phage head morphogenesis protein
MVLQVAARIEQAVRQLILPQLPSLVDEAQAVRPDSADFPVSQRQDGWVERAAALISAVSASLAAQTEDVSAVALDIGQKTSQWNSAQWQKILKTTLAVDVFQAEPYLRDQLKSFASENTRLIAKMTDEAIGEIDGIVQRGIAGGRRVEAIAKEIRTRFDVTRRKAKLIARDQVAKLNSQLTQLRQTELGVSKYIWRTSRDERVRESHRVMEGRTAVWNDPGVYLDDKGKRHPRSGILPVPMLRRAGTGRPVARRGRRIMATRSQRARLTTNRKVPDALLDPLTGSQQGLSWEHHAIHEGFAYSASFSNDLPAGEDKAIEIHIPAHKEMHLKEIRVWTTVGEALVSLVENPTIGNPSTIVLPAVNRNRAEEHADAESFVSLFRDPTSVSAGTELFVLKFESLDTKDARLSYSLFWYELECEETG